MEDGNHETCLISAGTSQPTDPKKFQEAWHYPIEKERDNWSTAIRKGIRSLIERGVWRKTDRKKIPYNKNLLDIFGYSRSREMALTGQVK